jgi:hypothetical protein
MKVLESVARAMWEQRRRAAKIVDIDLEEWGDGSVPAANGVMDEARVAIEAMRLPDEMWKHPDLHSEQVEDFNYVIDLILKGDP